MPRTTVGPRRDIQHRPELEAHARGLLGDTAQVYTMGPCQIVITREPTEGWHLSISCADRYPTWDEIADARYALLPDDRTFVMVFPPSSEYINVMPYCFHLYEEATS